MAETLRITDLRSGFEQSTTPSLNVTLSRGQHLVLSGASGCGKTSLLKVICGLLPPQQGQVNWQDTIVEPARFEWWRTQINYLPQDPIMGGDTIEQVLLLPWTMQATQSEKPEASTCEAVLASLDVDQPLDTEVSALSGGEKQRLAFARALLLARPVWLMDEPTSALDPDSRNRLIALLRNKNVVIVSVSHDPTWIASADITFDMEACDE